MKSPEQIVKHIDELEGNMLKRPRMYARSAACLEEKLMLLEVVRAFILAEDSDYVRSSYADYLMCRGHGVRLFTSDHGESWDEFCAFFREYLTEHGRGIE